MNRQILLVALAATGAVAIASCSGPADKRAASAERPSAAAAPFAAAQDPLLAAAEPFEALTEQAFDASPAALEAILTEARTKVAPARLRLSPAAAGKLDEITTRLPDLIHRQDRARTALSSMEAYRILVMAQDPATAKAPVPVSLLDYAGFKYSAQLKSRPAAWGAMSASVREARAEWSKISGSVRSNGLKGAFEEALGGMEDGARLKNPALAQYAAATELALVDLLEEHLARR
ncbi:MAG: hypothetical protein EPO51_25190 [Phenylobacterium sp.]|uniref:hypothetical protein n=1 Tax=Phenylobacterium sp. TaxID=1871053 RepID=UPI001226E017|nr:hypothetical protein [Phenylobacterium sp.]TAJ68829.1 MAG: hypothetical protein EPO51_25190 [Phenylobacterium sp.]